MKADIRNIELRVDCICPGIGVLDINEKRPDFCRLLCVSHNSVVF